MSDVRTDDGFATLISFADNPTVKFWEKEVTPPGFDGGGPNDTTTMRNTLWRTRAPKKLKTMDEVVATVSYAPGVYATIPSMINNNQLVTVTFPDGATVAVWGWLDKFKPGSNQDGQQPTAMITVVISNQNDSGVEVAPVYVA